MLHTPEEQPELTSDQAFAEMERFVVESDDLLELESRVGRFNVFDALRIVREEIRHSNFLAWLMDPIESHGQGQLFLRAALMDMLRHAPTDKRPFGPVALDGVDMARVEVRREWRHIDILILSDEPRLVIAIENKIDSEQGPTQLKDYREGVIEPEFPDREPFLVYLTREGDDPLDDRWIPYDYAKLHQTLDRCCRFNKDSIGEDVTVFLSHYLNMVRSHFMEDKKIDELCDRIYRNHRQALDLIYERKADPRRNIVRAFYDVLAAEGEHWASHMTGYGCHFVPKEWLDILPGVGKYTGKLGTHAWLRGVLWVAPTEIISYVELTPCGSESHRQKLLKAIQTRGKKYGFGIHTKKPGAEWTSVARHNIVKCKNGITDDDTTIEKVTAAVGEWHERMEKMTGLIRDVFSP